MDDLDFPPEPPKLPKQVDLHLGPAKVKAFKSVYHEPKTIGPGIMFLNVLIVVAALANLVLFFNVWKWMFV
jgi:hypothetical protein